MLWQCWLSIWRLQGSLWGQTNFSLTLATQNDTLSLSLDGVACNLGGLLDSWPLLEEQVAAVYLVGSFAQVHPVYQLCPFLDWAASLTVPHPLVASHLDYYNEIYMRLPLNIIQKLPLVQNAALYRIIGPQVCPCNTSVVKAALISIFSRFNWLLVLVITY